MRINLGCGPDPPEGWVNVDAAIGARLARVPLFPQLNRVMHITHADWPRGIVIHDLRRPLPWPDESAESVYASHVLEHVSREQGRRMLAECHRVLRDGGVLRVVVPDLRILVDEYLNGVTDARDFLHNLGTCDTDESDTF